MMHPAIHLLKKIPKGKTVTYKEIARVCKTSPRAIGRIMAGNTDPAHFPCYKVVSSSGELIGYSAPGGIAKKKKLLMADGVKFSGLPWSGRPDQGKRVSKECFYRFPYAPVD